MIKKLTVIAMTALLLGACQSDQDSDKGANGAELEEEAAAEQEPQETRRRYQRRERERPADVERQDVQEMPEASKQFIPDHIEGMLENDGPGLSLVIDASSREAFHDSLALIASETSETQYAWLEGAMDMLSFYDMDAQGWEGLLPILDGMTGEEVIERAEKIRSGQ